jgi:hypothetical protein
MKIEINGLRLPLGIDSTKSLISYNCKLERYKLVKYYKENEKQFLLIN